MLTSHSNKNKKIKKDFNSINPIRTIIKDISTNYLNEADSSINNHLNKSNKI